MIRSHLISREIGIDAGHRVTTHGSKCKSLHGHRYTIQAWCQGALHTSGAQAGMILDFGFLKNVMMTEIDTPCDHGMILWAEDPWMEWFSYIDDRRAITESLNEFGHWSGEGRFGKLYVVNFVPTTENLAAHWFACIAQPVKNRSQGLATLVGVKVWETPNCWAGFGSMFDLPNAHNHLT
jgi:6-pyruvoyltetrahydropterin/6-carboxytetrahydropterin synthase